MDVILLKPLETLGIEGQVVSVKPGYARNYLIPAGLAVAATPQQLSRLQTLRQQRDQKARRMLEEIYGWFTEGFNTSDLQEAQTLLTALR